MRWIARLAAPLAAALLAAALAPEAAAQGIVIPRHPERHPRPVPIGPAPVPLEVRSVAVETSIRGRVATTVVEQVFFNPAPAEVEGTYLFPLPEGAAVDRFSMWVDGRETAGELLDAGRAREVYEAIVRSRRDPALLEFVGTRLFRASIFPIPPRSEKRVRLAYAEVLTGDAGSVTWRLPLGGARHAPAPVGRASVVVDALSDRGYSSAWSPTHAVDVVRGAGKGVRVSWEKAGLRPEEDFVLVLQEPAGALGVSFAAHRPAGEEGTFLLLVAPAVEADAAPIPRDLVLCVDTSGSMAGEKMEQAKGALRHALRTLGPGDRFGIVAFATEPRRFRDALAPADAAAKEAALAFVDGLAAVGGTCIDDALQASLALLEGGAAERPGVVLFLTDGLPTIGERDPAAILERARRRAGPRTRLFAFGVGYDVNTRLLDGLAEDLRGARDYVAPSEDIERKVSTLVAKSSHPAMTDVTVAVEGAAVHDLYPRRLPDLFRGSELVVLGRYSGSGPAAVRIRGRVGGVAREFVHEATFPAREEGAAYLGRLWAVRRVGHLVDEIRLRGETAELKDEVVRLAKRYGILTPYTSYLVLEDERMLAGVPGRPDGTAALDGREFGERLRRLAGEVAGPAADRDGFGVGGGASGGASGGGDSGGASAPAPLPSTGKAGVDRSLEAKALSEAKSGDDEKAAGARGLEEVVRRVKGKTFYRRNDAWQDGDVAADAPRRRVVAFSDDYLALAAAHPDLARAFALGRVVVLHAGTVYEVVDA